MYFSLTAECGFDQKAANIFVNYFKNFTCKISNGLLVRNRTVTHQDCEGNWWATVSPYGVSYGSPYGDIDELKSDKYTKELRYQLYEHLKDSPDFRYALAGWEVDDFRHFSELDEDIIMLDFDGLVISQDIWEKFGCPKIFIPFRRGYYWRPIGSRSEQLSLI